MRTPIMLLVCLLYLISEHRSKWSSHFGQFPDGVWSVVFWSESKKDESSRKCDLWEIGHGWRLIETTEHHHRTSHKIYLSVSHTQCHHHRSLYICWDISFTISKHLFRDNLFRTQCSIYSQKFTHAVVERMPLQCRIMHKMRKICCNMT